MMVSRRCAIVLAVWLLGACGDFSDSQDDDEPSGELTDTVTVEDGSLQGIENRNYDVVQFLGVPYAAPPVAALRWREPQPVEPWTDVRSAISLRKSMTIRELILRVSARSGRTRKPIPKSVSDGFWSIHTGRCRSSFCHQGTSTASSFT